MKPADYASWIFLGAVALLAVGMNIWFMGWHVSAAQSIKDTSGKWQVSSRSALLKSTHLAQLERQLGYGGMIHNFKNYVLRRTPEYERRTEASMALAFQSIAQFQAMKLSDEDLRKVGAVWRTVDAYRANFERIRSSDWRELPASELDKLVKVDDTEAIAGLTALRESLMPVYLSEMAEMRSGLEGTARQMYAKDSPTFLLTILNIAVIGWAVYWLARLKLRRLHRARAPEVPAGEAGRSDDLGQPHDG